ncbi:tyrosine-type recombinase/integrase [Streptomyces mashuensis]|uniref:tyrosine-type recombinase/integrase n=1 Tax=Streptomyces mashuensis TaxID=33904 RepID=UPI00167E8E0D|nr:tyrosine-type recombinase/integrase [Streptomyces mashuensis]
MRHSCGAEQQPLIWKAARPTRSSAWPSADSSADPFIGLVFCRPDGRPLRPQTILDRFRKRAMEAHVSRIAIHDLRHLAATLSITANVPFIVVSKTLRHSALSTRQTSTPTSPAKLPTKPSTPSRPPSPRPRGKRSGVPAARFPFAGRGHTETPTAPSAAGSHVSAPLPRQPVHSPPHIPRAWPATTLRPPPPQTTESPPPHHCENGLRPAKTLVGTAGFEPTTP